MRKAPIKRLAILGIVCGGVAGLVLFRVLADQNRTVLLKWNAPPAKAGVTVAGYNVYRAIQSGGPFEKIASSVTGTAFTDRNVTSGVTYYYMVSAVDASGEESKPSQEASAAIPRF